MAQTTKGGTRPRPLDQAEPRPQKSHPAHDDQLQRQVGQAVQCILDQTTIVNYFESNIAPSPDQKFKDIGIKSVKM